ncbi:MAG TPA: PhnD/SsuA/transferrin family substrate-binding protein [Burkholderiales bacterium]|nr:PhnD/SsuA/transferrin family substrate-binding protein [Burkholderiales bacterium]
MGFRSIRKWLGIVQGAAAVAAAACAAPSATAAEQQLVLGIFPRYNATETATMYVPLAEHLSRRLGNARVSVVTAKDFDAFWKGVEQQKYDIVHYNQYHYIRSSQHYRVIGHSKEFGRSAVAGAIYVRKDSGITDLAQLRGRTVIFGGGKDAMMSYIGPRFLMMRAGLKDGDFKTEFAINPPNALLALYHRQADAAGGGDILIDLPVVKNAINSGELRILATTEPLLFLPWAVKHTMPAKQREAIQAILTELDKTDAGKAVLKAAKTSGIEKAEDKDYVPHRKMIDAVFGAQGTVKQ